MIDPASRRPGVYFETAPRPAADVLPRMDVAAFVGFAERGPLDVPVPVEDPARFRELFGTDPALARDPESGRIEGALLGPAVEAFFANGGRRCWVVRVAGRNGAEPVELAFPLVRLAEAAKLSPGVSAESAMARARARARGPWALGLAVGTALTVEPLRRMAAAGEAATFAAAPGRYCLTLASRPGKLRRGDLLELDFGRVGSRTVSGGGAPRALSLLLFVERLESPGVLAEVRATAGWWLASDLPPRPSGDGDPLPPAPELLTEAAGLAAARPSAPRAVRRLTLELSVWRGRHVEARLGDLAFHPDHPRFWAALPTDEALFRLPGGRLAAPRDPARLALLTEVDNPRFPLAGPAPLPGACLPLGMPRRAVPAHALAPDNGDTARADRLAASGLAGFSASLFLDPGLARVGLGALAAEAEHRLARAAERTVDRPLVGIHSLYPVDEVTLVAVPDAVHRRWSRHLDEPATSPLGAPGLRPLVSRPGSGAGSGQASDPPSWRASWTPVPGAFGYRLERSSAPDFTDQVTIYRGAETTADVDPPDPCPGRWFFRVRAEGSSRGAGEVGPWSNTRSRVLPAADLGSCADRPPLGLVLSAVPGAGSTRLSWHLEGHPGEPAPLPAGARSELQEAADPGFETARTLSRAAASPFALAGVRAATLYYRVRLASADGTDGTAVADPAPPGPWSNTVTLLARDLAAATLEPPQAFEADDLLAVHRALTRLAAARGDLLALLALPRHYRAADLADHLAALDPPSGPRQGPPAAVAPTAGADRVPRLTLGEASALSFAALYHPWLAAVRAGVGEPAGAAAGSDAGREVRLTPPDGPVAGTLALRARRGGAWLAPANLPFADGLALEPALGDDATALLAPGRANLLVQEPRGFLVASEHTLSLAAQTRPIHVRRLLALLRRLALREGTTDVFEPNDATFRAAVHERFRAALTELFTRGAFAGDTPARAFRVVTGESVNPPESIDAGRFVVELRVAPSQPLVFLRVRLVQSGPEELAVQEI